MEKCLRRSAVHLDLNDVVLHAGKRQHLLQQRRLFDAFRRCDHLGFAATERHSSPTTTVSL